MAVSNDLHTLFEARREVFEIVDGHPTDADLYRIIEVLAKLLYPIQFDKEGGKHNLIGLIMDKPDYTKRFGSPLPCPKRRSVHNKLIANGTTHVICAKSEAIHHACITNWDSFEAAERE